MGEESSYSDSPISRLTPREHVRLRPSMYMGGVDQRALHRMVFEVINDPVEEALLGKCDHIWLTLHPNEVISIRDNSQGLPIRLLKSGKRLLEYIMTETGTRRIRGDYAVTGGMMGVGLSAVNALSSECTVEVMRDDFLWRQTYREGVPQSDVVQVRPLESGESTGTSITFRPDFSILEPNAFHYDTLRNRMRELAYLVPGLAVTLCDERGQMTEQEEFHFVEGLADYVADLNRDQHPLHPSIKGSAEWTIRQEPKAEYMIRVDVALQYADTMDTRVIGYVNTLPITAGLHTNAIPFALSAFLRNWDYPELKERFSIEECMPGLTAVVNIRHPQPVFENAIKTEFTNHDVVSVILDAVHSALRNSNHEDTRKRIVEKCLANRRALHGG